MVRACVPHALGSPFLSVPFSLPRTDAPPSTAGAPPSTPTPTPSTGKRPLLLTKRAGLGLGSPLGQGRTYSHAKRLPVAQRPSVFQSPDEDEDEDDEQWLEIKGNSRDPPSPVPVPRDAVPSPG